MRQSFKELLQYARGEKFISDKMYNWDDITEEDVNKASWYITVHQLSSQLEMCDRYKDFIKMCPDAKQYVTDDNIFYALKNGYFIPGVPGELVFCIRRIFKYTTTINAILFKLSDRMLTDVFTFGYLKNGITLIDVILKVTFPFSQFVSEEAPIWKGPFGVEVFISNKCLLNVPLYVERDYPMEMWFIKGDTLYLNRNTKLEEVSYG